MCVCMCIYIYIYIIINGSNNNVNSLHFRSLIDDKHNCMVQNTRGRWISETQVVEMMVKPAHGLRQAHAPCLPQIDGFQTGSGQTGSSQKCRDFPWSMFVGKMLHVCDKMYGMRGNTYGSCGYMCVLKTSMATRTAFVAPLSKTNNPELLLVVLLLLLLISTLD